MVRSRNCTGVECLYWADYCQVRRVDLSKQQVKAVHRIACGEENPLTDHRRRWNESTTGQVDEDSDKEEFVLPDLWHEEAVEGPLLKEAVEWTGFSGTHAESFEPIVWWAQKAVHNRDYKCNPFGWRRDEGHYEPCYGHIPRIAAQVCLKQTTYPDEQLSPGRQFRLWKAGLPVVYSHQIPALASCGQPEWYEIIYGALPLPGDYLNITGQPLGRVTELRDFPKGIYEELLGSIQSILCGVHY
jgi:hypothetical protein